MWPEGSRRGVASVGSAEYQSQPMAAVRTATLLLLAGCAAGGAQHFEAGRRFEAAGNLTDAHAAFTRAAAESPGDRRFIEAKQRAGAALALDRADEAERRERASDLAGAADAWAEAERLDPANPEYGARAALASARAERLTVPDWLAAVRVVVEEFPDSEQAKRRLAEAVREAYAHHAALAKEALARKDGAEALTHLEAAREIDAGMPGLTQDQFDEAEARVLAEEGERFALAGDAASAFERYRAAVAKRPLPDIEAAMRGVKARAAALQQRLERARALAASGRLDQALAIYDPLITERAPEALVAEAASVRRDRVSAGSEEARRLAERDNLRGALASLDALVPHLELEPSDVEQIRAAVALAREGQPAAARTAAEKAGLSEDSPVSVALRAVTLAEARRQLAGIRRVARKNGAAAVVQLAQLSTFEGDLPDIATLRRSLQGEAFSALLAEAVRAARRGDDLAAAAALSAALEASDLGEGVRASAAEGIESLKSGQPAAAEKAFGAGLAAAPRARFFDEARQAARLRREAMEQQALAALKRGAAGQERALDVLGASFALLGGSDAAQKGRTLLEDRLRTGKLSPAEEAQLLSGLLRLSEAEPDLRARLDAATGHHRAERFEEAEQGFAGGGAHPVATRGRALAAARLASRLEGAITEATPAAADAAAKLLARDPADPKATRAVDAWLTAAEAAAGRKDDAEAARLLGLATRASVSAEPARLALERGHAALVAGDLAAATAAYAEAKAIAPTDRVAARSDALARRLDREALGRAVEAGGAEAGAALATAFSRDPSGPAAAAALERLLAEGDAAVAAGRYAEASDRYEAANVVTPADAKEAVSTANRRLAEGRLPDALAGYPASAVGSRAKAAVAAALDAQRVAAARALAAGEETDDHAEAVRALFSADPTRPEVRAAVTAVLDRAEASAGDGDGEAVARRLALVAAALGQRLAVATAVDRVRQGRLPEASEALARSEGLLRERGPGIVERLRTQKLSAGLDAGGMEAARSLRDLLRAKPEDPAGRKAFAALLARVKERGAAGDSTGAAAAVRELAVASAASGELLEAFEAAADALDGSVRRRVPGGKVVRESGGAKQPAAAERRLLAASAEQRSAALDAATAAARALREADEAAALREIESGADPRAGVDRLLAAKAVHPASSARGVTLALGRAKAAASANDRALLAQSLAAAASLESEDPEAALRLGEAAERVAKGELEAAERAYASASGPTAEAGRALARQLRVAGLRAQVEAAADQGAVLEEAKAVDALLELEPSDRAAQKRKAQLGVRVRETRLASARGWLGRGQPGVAWLEATRALALDPKDRAAAAVRTEAEAALGKPDNLVLVVEAPRRDGLEAEPCPKIEASMQVALMEGLSKRTNLGGYVLSEGWTKAWKSKDPRAPKVGGGLEVTVEQCAISPGEGRIAGRWVVQTPRSGKAAAEGGYDVELRAGSLPKDEEDSAGANVKKLLLERLEEAIADGIAAQRTALGAWLLTSAEHGLAAEAPEAAAAAYARFRMGPGTRSDPDRVASIETALERAFP